jgi:hypothetical protein
MGLYRPFVSRLYTNVGTSTCVVLPPPHSSFLAVSWVSWCFVFHFSARLSKRCTEFSGEKMSHRKADLRQQTRCRVANGLLDIAGSSRKGSVFFVILTQSRGSHPREVLRSARVVALPVAGASPPAQRQAEVPREGVWGSVSSPAAPCYTPVADPGQLYNRRHHHGMPRITPRCPNSFPSEELLRLQKACHVTPSAYPENRRPSCW